MSTPDHTPTPWERDTEKGRDGTYDIIFAEVGRHGTEVIVDNLNAHFGMDEERRRANAEFIVLAVNMHDELVEALKALTEFPHMMASKEAWPELNRLREQARAVLKKAGAL